MQHAVPPFSFKVLLNFSGETVSHNLVATCYNNKKEIPIGILPIINFIPAINNAVSSISVSE